MNYSLIFAKKFQLGFTSMTLLDQNSHSLSSDGTSVCLYQPIHDVNDSQRAWLYI